MVLSFTLVLIFFSSFLLFLEHIFCFSNLSTETLSPYECGFEPVGPPRLPFCMKFFLLAIIFLVFDVELAFLIPCLYSSVYVCSFVILLLLGLYLEYAYGGLDWIY